MASARTTHRLALPRRFAALALLCAGTAAGAGVAAAQLRDGALRGDLRGPLRSAIEETEPLSQRSLLDVPLLADEPGLDAPEMDEPLRQRRSATREADEERDETRADPWAGEPLTDINDPAGRQNRRIERENLRAGGTAGGLRGTADALDPATTGTVPLAASTSEDLARNARVEALNGRATAIGIAARRDESDPFAPVGLRLGSLELFPSIEQGLGWTSNASGGAGGSSAIYSETTLRLSARTIWDLHQASLDAFGILRRELEGAEIDDTEAGVNANLRLDLAGDYAATAAASFLHRPESASSPVSFEGSASRPDRRTLAGELGIAKDEGRLRLGLTGNVTRDTFTDAVLDTGETLSQADRDSTLVSATLRAGYELSSAIVPFAEAELGRRLYDNEVDSAGYRRSADRLAMRAGLDLDLGEKFGGEVALGWISETPDDARLEPVSGLELSGSLRWSPMRGTLVDLDALTSVEGTTDPGASGSLLYAANLGVTRELRSNLTGSAGFGAEYRDYSASDAYDVTWSGEVGLIWWLNRYLGLTGRARHEIVQSSDAGRESETTSLFIGLRAQR